MSDPNIPASEQAERENLSHLRPDVLRVAAGLAANDAWIQGAVREARGLGAPSIVISNLLARDALAIVQAVDRLCGVDDE